MSQSYKIDGPFVAGSPDSKGRLHKVARVVADTGSDLVELYDHMTSPRFALKIAIFRTVAALAISLALARLILTFSV